MDENKRKDSKVEDKMKDRVVKIKVRTNGWKKDGVKERWIEEI